MIHFFRRIRQALLRDNNYQKYALYAIGEICLVMIGILLALQINNWNEQKKTDANELRMLEGLHSSIENELDGWNFILNNNYTNDSSYQIISEYIENQIPYDKTLNRHFAKTIGNPWYHELNFTAYETAKAYSLNFIKDQETVNQLSDLYERWHKIYVKVNQDSRGFYDNIAGPYLFEIFERKIGDEGWLYILIDYDSLIKDKKFRSLLEQFQMYRLNTIRWQKDILSHMHKALELLDKEMMRYDSK